jgi:hypothetical protein
MKSTMPLSEALQRAARTLDAEPLPPQLRARIHASLQAAPAAQLAQTVAVAATPVRQGWAWGWSGAVGCAFVLLLSVVLMLRPPAQDAVLGGPARGAAVTESSFSSFVPLATPDRWPADAGAAWLVRTELRGHRLAAMGLPFDPAHAGDSVRAELLVHPSGELLAVRFMP